MSYRLGVDVGGTFTDLLLIDIAGGETFRAKVPTTPGNQALGILDGITRVCKKAGIEPRQIVDVMHGTTVATNAVLEGKGAKVGLMTTAGYKQVLQIARSFVPGGLAGWIVWPKPEPLAALENTVEVNERVGAKGDIVRPLDEASVRAGFRVLAGRNVESVTVSLINSFANPAHELRIRELGMEEIPRIPISLSSDILPEMREYERTLTTVANSYVRPTVARYLESLKSELGGRGIKANLKVLRSDGGLMSFDVAETAPVNLLMSGPAGGVAGALWIARQAGFENLLTFDMGGTSTDVALIEGGVPKVRRETRVGDVTVRASSLDVRTVGAGGGSIAKVPALTGALRVGPESAGAVPGPAAYGKGGTMPTVTDANVVLGYLPVALLGGEMKLDVEASFAAVKTIADALGTTIEEAAAGIVNIVNENMLGALRLVSVEQGYDPRDFALIAFGGAGPLHANALGKLTGAWPVIIPPSPGVLCAYGDATTRVRNEAARTFIRRFGDTSVDEVVGIFHALGATASEVLSREGVELSAQIRRYEADVRYHGQGFEITVEVSEARLLKEGLDAITGVFEDTHERQFTFRLDVEAEFVNLRAIVLGPETKVKATVVEKGSADASAAVTASTRIFVDGRHADAMIYDRSRLASGNKVYGPAIVTEMDSTTLILPDHAGEVDQFGNILIQPLAKQGVTP